MYSLSSRGRSAAVIHPRSPYGTGLALERAGFDVLTVPFDEHLDTRLAEHPDLQIFAADGHAFVHPDTDVDFAELCSHYARVITCSTPLGAVYPEDCPYNIAYTGKFALCMERIIPAEIRDFFSDRDIIIIDIPQGYAKCSVMVIDENSVITEDEGIRRNAEKHGIDVLTVRKGVIPLQGFPYGFIGGVSGTHGDAVYLTGDLSQHPDYPAIRAFIADRGKKIVPCSASAAEDTGSIIFL